jgi:FYVE zinc finger
VQSPCSWFSYCHLHFYVYNKFLVCIRTTCQHHCRKCGAVCCSTCTDKRWVLHYVSPKPVRVCRKCYEQLLFDGESKCYLCIIAIIISDCQITFRINCILTGLRNVLDVKCYTFYFACFYFDKVENLQGMYCAARPCSS